MFNDKIQPKIIFPPTPEQQRAIDEAWKKKDKEDMKNPQLTEAERNIAAQRYLERSTNPNFQTDSQMVRSNKIQK